MKADDKKRISPKARREVFNFYPFMALIDLLENLTSSPIAIDR
jgi:hypothetical protein